MASPGAPNPAAFFTLQIVAQLPCASLRSLKTKRLDDEAEPKQSRLNEIRFSPDRG